VLSSPLSPRPHHALTTPSPRLPPQEFGFTPDSVLQLAAPLRRPECRVSSLILGEWQINPLALLDDAGTLAFGLADGQSSDVVLTCALLQDTERGAAVRSLDLEHIGSRLGVAGFGAVIRLIESGTMSGLTSISLRHMDMHVHMHTHMHMHMRIRMDMHMGTHMHMHMHMHMRMRMPMHMHMHPWSKAYAHAHTHTHTVVGPPSGCRSASWSRS
jgi:hypothetical protein